MTLTKKFGVMATVMAFAALVIFVTAQSGSAGANGYTMGSESLTLENLPEPNGCVSHRQYDVTVRQSWIGPNEAKDDRQFGPYDQWPESITVDNLDPGGGYRFDVVATCQVDDDTPLSASKRTSLQVAGDSHTGGWYYHYVNGDRIDLHIHPATICDEGYRFGFRAKGQSEWTNVYKQQGMATPASDLHAGFIVFTADFDSSYFRTRAGCVHEITGNGVRRTAEMSYSERID